MRITLDTNVLVRSHFKAFGPARRLLNLITSRRHELVLSQQILYEVEKVLSYPKLRKASNLTDLEVAEYIRRLANTSTLVDLGNAMPFPIRDQDDWMVLRTAIRGNAQILCTDDRDLHHKVLESTYASAKIEVLTESQLLTRLSSET